MSTGRVLRAPVLFPSAYPFLDDLTEHMLVVPQIIQHAKFVTVGGGVNRISPIITVHVSKETAAFR